MTERLKEAMISYGETFGTNFPGALFGEYSDDEVADLMEKCVQLHKTPEEITGRDYDPLCDY